MIDPISFLLFTSASTIALAIPGPTIALVITRSLSDGRHVSVPLAIGIGLGTLVGSTAAIAGAGAILTASASAFTAIKFIGAAYIIYLGIKLFTAEPTPLDIAVQKKRSSTLHGLRDGFFVTSLNPKSIAFSAAFIPQFIGPDSSYLWQATILVITFSALATLNGLAFAFGTDVLRRFVRRLSVLRWMNRVGGSFLVASGVAGLFLKRPTV
ncbi:LysE family translocator [Aestuariibius sp. 2305UL40-4]|uniref:LysE family translocator n=1 Tax=Aestuariibius violaceus TaxID=3234132 RepID=UPI00345F09F9